MVKTKRLYRVKKGAIFGGVCQGIAEFFEVDATLIRLLWVTISIFTASGLGGLIAYLICVAMIPEAPRVDE